jgi:hypothetical protein
MRDADCTSIRPFPATFRRDARCCLVDSAVCRLPRLEFPSWLARYPSVADEGESIYEGILRDEREYQEQPTDARLPRKFAASEQIAILSRLVTDKRMDRVWRELYRKKRGSNEFSNPAKRQGLFKEELTTLHDPLNQDMAVRAFLNFAFMLAPGGLRLITQDWIDSKARPYAKMAYRLRRDAEGLRALGLSELAASVEVVAIDCEKGVYIPKPNILMPIVKRSRGDDVVRAFVLQMSAICREVFGNALSGTVATTANVALSKKISRHQVRDIVRAHVSQCCSQ